MNHFLKNHQLNKAEIGVTDESISDQIELVVHKILSPLSHISKMSLLSDF